MKVTGYENLDIITSNHDYEILSFYELSDKWQQIAKKEFDYLAHSPHEMFETTGYFIYRKQLYNLSNFMYSSKGVYKFGKNREFRIDGHNGDSYFSSTVVQLDRNGESCKVARLYC